jgi:uncharacterized secreted protein with C-terminal beta-propeller domain
VFIVTFERIDPLYIIDLSDPLNPTFTQEIVLPGFDTYQHVWSEDHLIGIGYNIDPTTGWMSGMKMTAYNVGENARELQTLNISQFVTTTLPDDLDTSWTFSHAEALWNHKAILVSPELNVFGFAVNAWAGGYRSVSTDDDTPASNDASTDDQGEPSSDESSYYFEYHSMFFLFQFDFTLEQPILEPIMISHPTSMFDYVNVDRGVMINDVIHTLSNRQVISYSLTEKTIIQTVTFA